MSSASGHLRGLLDAATPGRIRYDGICYLFRDDGQMIADDSGPEGTGDTVTMRGVGANLPLDKNAAVIVALWNSAPALVALIEACEVMRLRQAHATGCRCHSCLYIAPLDALARELEAGR